jgi:pilus assembly protein CpaE
MNLTKPTFNSESESDPILSRPLSLVAVGLDTGSAELLKQMLAVAPQVRLKASFPSGRTEDATAIAGQTYDLEPDVCLVDFDADRTRAAAITRQIRAIAPEIAVFAVSSQAQPDAIIEAMRSGCSEYLVKPINRQELLKGLARIGTHRREVSKKKVAASQVITFLGAKGGCGVTTLVTQMGAALASSSARKALLIDLHPDLGDAALYLGLAKHLYNSFELIDNADRLDAEFLQAFLAHHSSGLDLIPAPEGSGGLWSVAPGELAKVLDFLRSSYEFILLDVPPRLNEQNLELVRYSDRVYLITVPEVSALRNVVRQMEYFLQNQVAEDKIRVVLNRHHKRGPLTDGEIEKAIRRPLFWKVPNQYAQVVKTISGGNPIAHLASSEVMRSVSEWAVKITKGSSERKQDPRGGIFGFWSR